MNTHEMGDIVRFALDNRDIVRSVNFQPVAHFGRYESNDGRFAIDDATRLLAEQMETLEPRDMLPAPCCSAYCQIGTAFVPRETAPGGENPSEGSGSGGIDAEFVPLTSYVNDFLWDTISGMVDEEDYMELLAGTAAGEEWACKTADCCGVGVPDSIETLFEEVVPVSFTGFMDADAADVNRLSNCCIS
ncbi:MAG: radical SAM protein, partial [Halobaculum sp.]